MKINLLLLFFSFSFTGCAQQFQYKEINANIKSKTEWTNSEILTIKKQFFSNAKLLTDYLPSNYDKTGKTDYTAFLQKGINSNTDIIFPDFPILIGPQGLQLKSNSKILFQKNSKLKVQPNDKEFYAALNFENVENVKLYFANLEGERHQHLNNKGEWGMGIYIVHSKNIYIYKPKITKFWGDGIYIGKVDGITSQNIIIDGAFIDESRRNGISIIAGKQIKITNSVIANTYGTSPEYGIDIEPNKPEDELKDIVLENNVTYNNYKGGLLFALDNLQGTSNEITVQINNHSDYFSDKGVEFFIDRGYTKFKSPLKGSIVLNGIKLYDNKTSLINNDSKQSTIKLQLSNIYSDNIKVNSNKLNNFVKKFETGNSESIK